MTSFGGKYGLGFGFALGLLLLVGCGRNADEVGFSQRLKDFGELCLEHMECRSTYCLPHPNGAFCSQKCELTCPTGWECKEVPDPHGEGTVGLCAVVQNHLCAPCLDDSSCNLVGSDLCMPFPEGDFCSIDCTYAGCPQGYSCLDVERDGDAYRQCLPDSNTCACTSLSVGMLRGCEQGNEMGVCSGFETCLSDEIWGVCSAPTPVEESCNGLDDDCDGFFDEDLVAARCTIQNEFGSCSADEQCDGLNGWICPALTPAEESCNNVDDDCNGATDEGFRDALGRYVLKQHCGGCGVDCDLLIPHATETECRIVDERPQCRALSCESGYFVYQEGLACLVLPANLCDFCSVDEDCVAPGSRCLERGAERFCGRSCAQDSPYGTYCPSGYQCVEDSQGAQCAPITDTCICDEEQLGMSRSCMVDTCMGFQTCESSVDGASWSSCNIEDFNVEICDGSDNNCDGNVDEGFLNPLTGLYDNDEHCGFCFNDCSAYWSSEIHHTEGLCQVSGGAIRCAMGPCESELVDGVNYEWVDVNADEEDGCECRRRAGNTDQDDPDLVGLPESGYTFIDENCDGIDGVIEESIFVRAGHQGDGTMDNPLGSITDALNLAQNDSRKTILVAEGFYDEAVQLRPGINLHGGYSADFRSRDLLLYQSIIQADSGAVSLEAEGIQTATLFSGFVVQGPEHEGLAGAGQEGEASIGMQLVNCNSNLQIRSSTIAAGRAQGGGRGQAGSAGNGRQNDLALDGGDGLDGLRTFGHCSNNSRTGGQGGINGSCPAANANPGGSALCPSFNQTTNQGAQAQYSSASDNNGLGGWDWSFDDMSGAECGHATESGFPSSPQSNVGDDGRDGLDGDNGQGGLGGPNRASSGTYYDGTWRASAWRATAGSEGAHGVHGGGGGAGGGTAYFSSLCGMHEIGPSGGGGGAGGCGGTGGAIGMNGGASIAIIVANESASPLAPELLYNDIQRGLGGAGGAGGIGGEGGQGGLGGFGGGPPSWIGSEGGKGGNGGNGGPGGGGGGGVGGPSFDILLFGLSEDTLSDTNLFTVDPSIQTSGMGGRGGASVGSDASGGDGQSGRFGHVLSMSSCASSACPTGFRCDPYSICVPE